MEQITEPVLIDAGPLVALLCEGDGYHELCREQADQIVGPVFTTWAVAAEAAWLLRSEPNGLHKLLDEFDGDATCLHLERSAIPQLAETARKYADLQPQLADLTLLYLANQLQMRHIFTLDRRDFSAFRDANGKPFKLLPESL